MAAVDKVSPFCQAAGMHAAVLAVAGPADEPAATVQAVNRRLRDGYRLREFTAPSALAPEQRPQLLATLEHLSAQAFGVDMAPYWQARTGNFFEQVSYLAIMVDPDGRPVGWTCCRSARLRGSKVLYWDATGVLPGHQRHGLIPQVQGRMYRRVFLTKGRAPLWTVYRTRSPVVLRSLRQTLGPDNVYPSLTEPVPGDVRSIAEDVASWLGDMPAVDTSSLVVRGAYDETGPALLSRPGTAQQG